MPLIVTDGHKEAETLNIFVGEWRSLTPHECGTRPKYV